MASPPTVFVVDDDQSVRQSIIALLEVHGFVCREFDSADTFLDGYAPGQAGCLVTDLAMPGMTGLDLYRELRHRGWIIPTIVIAGDADIRETVQAMQQGVISVLVKPIEQAALVDAVRLSLDIDSKLRASARKLAELNRLFSHLTEGEVEVLDRLVLGKSHRVIAAELDIAKRTVEYRWQRLSQKLGVQGVATLGALVAERDYLLDSTNIRDLAEALGRLSEF